MGREKAAIVIDGVTLLERAIQAVRAAGAHRVVVVGLAPTTAIIANSLPTFVRLVPDTHVGLGPLSGLVAGLAFLRDHDERDEYSPVPDAEGLCLVVACDHPELSPPELRSLVRHLALAPPTTLVLLPVVNGRSQPLHAAYRRGAIDPLEDAFQAGERSLVRALEAMGETLRTPTSGAPVLLFERQVSDVDRSYIDVDDQIQLQTYLNGTALIAGEPSFNDSTSG